MLSLHNDVVIWVIYHPRAEFVIDLLKKLHIRLNGALNDFERYSLALCQNSVHSLVYIYIN